MPQIKKNNPSISALKGSAAQEVVNNVRTQLLGLCWGCGIMSAMCDYAYIYIYIFIYTHTYIYIYANTIVQNYACVFV